MQDPTLSISSADPNDPTGEVVTRCVQVRGLELAYETFGRPEDPVMILVMGLGTQMIAWPDELCRALAATGRYVVRYDNRDIGLSTHLSSLPVPNPAAVMLRRAPAPYAIVDMADDLIGLMDELGIPAADIVGASMGGFITQATAIQAPHRVRSMTLIMTTTGSARVGRPKAKAFGPALFRKRPTNRDEAIEATLATFDRIGSPGYPADTEQLRSLAARSLDRAFDPDGVVRQLAACLRQPDRTPDLHRLRTPTVVLHGLSDPLVAPSGGLALAKAIRGSKFVGYPGMGHDLPRQLWGSFAEEIITLSDRTLAARAQAGNSEASNSVSVGGSAPAR